MSLASAPLQPGQGSAAAVRELDCAGYLALFAPHGGTDVPYASHHFERFRATLLEFDASWDRHRGLRVLDVGAHWLHQALLWQRAGYQVTAVDLPITLEFEQVRSLAAAEGITLVANPDLERSDALGALPEDGFEVILFAEIIEHLTFNPVHLWRTLYRLLAPGGRIVVTTPNYYAWNGQAWDLLRFLRGSGGGISVDAVLRTRTHGHHWREYARPELMRYFHLLSPDFRIVKAKTMRNYYPAPDRGLRRLAQRAFESVSFLRPNVHMEIELAHKRHGIVIEPGW
jgi:2-polyprenyl-6-hydroxyphenyl methylase/3-demethylubiquinone-9 3-methyltransferase